MFYKYGCEIHFCLHFLINVQAIIDAVNAESLENIRLSGRHVSSLADIALRKDSKVSSSYQRDSDGLFYFSRAMFFCCVLL